MFRFRIIIEAYLSDNWASQVIYVQKCLSGEATDRRISSVDSYYSRSAALYTVPAHKQVYINP